MRETFCQNRAHLILQLVTREVCSQTILDKIKRTAPAKILTSPPILYLAEIM